jgi:hypothetical protein
MEGKSESLSNNSVLYNSSCAGCTTRLASQAWLEGGSNHYSTTFRELEASAKSARCHVCCAIVRGIRIWSNSKDLTDLEEALIDWTARSADFRGPLRFEMCRYIPLTRERFDVKLKMYTQPGSLYPLRAFCKVVVS